jgi:tyrosyl-tRNA synthetase
MLTFLPLDEIEKMESWQGAELNKAKEILAYELTKLVHGEEEAEKALAAAKNIFAGGKDSADMPTVTLSEDDLGENGIGILDIMVKSGLCGSKSEARTLVTQGGVSVNEEKLTVPATFYTKEQLSAGLLIQKGKKKFIKVNI